MTDSHVPYDRARLTDGEQLFADLRDMGPDQLMEELRERTELSTEELKVVRKRRFGKN